MELYYYEKMLHEAKSEHSCNYHLLAEALFLILLFTSLLQQLPMFILPWVHKRLLNYHTDVNISIITCTDLRKVDITNRQCRSWRRPFRAGTSCITGIQLSIASDIEETRS